MEYLEFIWPFQRNKIEEIIVIITVGIVYSSKCNDCNKENVRGSQHCDLWMNNNLHYGLHELIVLVSLHICKIMTFTKI